MSAALQYVEGGGKGCYLNLVGFTRAWGERAVKGWRTGGRDDGREKEVGLITVPSAFALRRIRQPYLPGIL